MALQPFFNTALEKNNDVYIAILISDFYLSYFAAYEK